MKNLLLRLTRDESGQDLIEYGLLIALISLGAVSSFSSLARAITSMFSSSAANLGTVAS